MAWVALLVCGLVLWGSSAAVLAMGRDIWPGEMPEAVRLATAPAIAAAATLAHKIVAPDFDAVLRAAAFTLIVAALDALVLAPLLDRSHAMFRTALGSWLPLAAIFLASYLTGAHGPM
jgi:hypothetical protein